jgi:hypothetical protein
MNTGRSEAEMTPEQYGIQQRARDDKTRVMFDAYSGLRSVGYNRYGAVRALTMLGVSKAEADAIAGIYAERKKE